MKTKLFTALIASALTMGSIAHGAVTISIKNFTSVTAGIPIVDAVGAAVAKSTVWASAGIFTTTPDWSTANAAQVIAAFTALDLVPLVNSGITGVFTGPDQTNLPYPTNFSGAASYILVGNAATLASSTKVAVYRTGSTYTLVDGAGNATVALNGTVAANWVYGIPTKVTVQPATLNGAAFVDGIQLAATGVPEPSAALLGALGALGLLRRRRI